MLRILADAPRYTPHQNTPGKPGNKKFEMREDNQDELMEYFNKLARKQR